MKPSNPGEKSFLTTKKKGNVVINPKKEDLMKETKLDEKKLDPVGKEDKDIDNDGDHDKSDKYLLNRRKVRSKVIKMREAAYDALRAKRAKKPQGEGAVDTAPDESNVGEETLHEISANKLIDAAKAAEVKRGKAAVAGDKETAKKAIGQNKKFYDAAKAKRMKESTDRMKERMIQFTKDHDNQMSGKQPI
tara:strand:- start:396 stop:968 length:573 start_codon:yes stop_codon:yes gene_type:complete